MLSWQAPEAPPAPAAQRIRPPVENMRYSSTFGQRADPLHGSRRRHSGIDLPQPRGTLVYASAGGVISFAGTANGYGKLVEIDHGGGVRTRYAHLSQFTVTSGMAVVGGDVVGFVGSTGRSTGNHLHYEVRIDGRAVDPRGVLGAELADFGVEMRRWPAETEVASRWAGWSAADTGDRLSISSLK